MAEHGRNKEIINRNYRACGQSQPNLHKYREELGNSPELNRPYLDLDCHRWPTPCTDYSNIEGVRKKTTLKVCPPKGANCTRDSRELECTCCQRVSDNMTPCKLIEMLKYINRVKTLDPHGDHGITTVLGRGGFGEAISFKYKGCEYAYKQTLPKYSGASLVRNCNKEFQILNYISKKVALKVIPKAVLNIANEHFCGILMRHTKNITGWNLMNKSKFIVIENGREKPAGPDSTWFSVNRKTTLNNEELFTLFVEPWLALFEIHKVGIFHLDIKPENICFGIVESGDKAILNAFHFIDFGLAEFVESSNGTQFTFPPVAEGFNIKNALPTIEGFPKSSSNASASRYSTANHMKIPLQVMLKGSGKGTPGYSLSLEQIAEVWNYVDVISTEEPGKIIKTAVMQMVEARERVTAEYIYTQNDDIEALARSLAEIYKDMGGGTIPTKPLSVCRNAETEATPIHDQYKLILDSLVDWLQSTPNDLSGRTSAGEKYSSNYEMLGSKDFKTNIIINIQGFFNTLGYVDVDFSPFLGKRIGGSKGEKKRTQKLRKF